MTDKARRPREFWLRYDKNGHFLTCHKKAFTIKNMGDTSVHVREVLPDDEFANYISDLIKTRSETFDEARDAREKIDRVTRALEKAKEELRDIQKCDTAGVFTLDIALVEIEKIERGEVKSNE